MEVIYGINPLKVLLGQQQTGLEKIIAVSGKIGPSLRELIAIARQKKIPTEFHNRQYLDQLTGSTHHQGIAGLCHSFSYSDLDDLLANNDHHLNNGLVIILDSVMDPQNLGAIIRTSYCLGANGLIIPVDRAAAVTSGAIKASAGSAGQLPIARVTNLSQTIDYLKEKNFWVFGADARGGSDLPAMDFNCNVTLVLGGEAKGIRPLIKKKCDFLLSVALLRNFDSLNVSVAAGIILYEIFKQRSRKTR